MKKIVILLATVSILSSSYIKAQCTQKLQIESILVDACNLSGSYEPNNEMVRFKNGPNPLNISQISIEGAPASGVFTNNVWPTTSLSWNGLVQNATTSATTASLQATVVSPCGKLIEPPSGIIPANADVLMITATNPDIAANSFANLIDTLYIVYHNATYTVTTGHFANYSATPGTRGLILKDNAHGCSDTVSYDVSLLSPTGNGDGVNYTNAGIATYYNQGCQAAFVPISVSINVPASACGTATLTGVISGPAATYTWTTNGTGSFSTPTGTLSVGNTTTLTPSYMPGAGESGVVSFTITAQGKCTSAIGTATGSITINTVPSLSVSSSSGTTICKGSSTALSVSSTGTLATTYTWTPSSPTATGASFTVAPTNTTAPTIYTVTAHNTCGNSNATFTITVNPLPIITTVNDSVCVTGTGTVTASGATTYTWNTGVHTSSLSGGVNTYTVTGTNGSGCVGTATAQVVSVALPTINTNISSICENVAANLTASGGTSYTWSPGNTNGSSLSVTPSNTTAIVVTGAGVHGCKNTHTVTVNATPTITVNGPSSTCLGNAVTLQASPSTLTSYTWTGATSSASSATVSPTSNASYTVQGTNANGCVSNAVVSTVSITAASPISVVSTNTVPCVGSTYTLSANGATTYTWVASSGTFSSLNGNSTQISVNQPDVNPITFSVSGTGACPATPTVITINPASTTTLSVNSSPSASVCAGSTVTLTASGANTYTWNPAISNGTAFTPTASTTYSVNATDANGCAATSATVAVTVNATPTLSVNNPSTCSGMPVTLTTTVTPSTLNTYTWTGVSSLTSTTTVAPTVGTSYSVQGTDANGCLSNVAVSNVTISTSAAITVSSTNNTPCVGSTYTLSASPANTFTWVASSGTYTSLDGNNTQISVIQPDANPVTFTVSGTGACAGAPATITINPLSVGTLSVSSSAVCSGNNVTFTASGANTYTWSTSDNASSINISAINNQTVTVVGTDAGGCVTAPFVATATVNTLPTVSITANPSSNTICSGNTVTLTASGATSYTWNSGSNANPLTDNPTTNTTYSIIGIDNNSCVNTATVSITVNISPTTQTISATNSVVCAGSSITLSTPISGVWTGPAPSTATVNTGSSANIMQGGVYTFHNNSGSCGDATTTYTVVGDSVTATIAANPLTGQIPLSVTFTSTATSALGANITYTWTLGDGNSSTIANPAETYTTAGTYSVVMMASDGMCNDSKSLTIVVNDLPSVLIIPNIFTPNGDGVNDVFFVTGSNITNFECTIFDRWGLLLYSWNGLDGAWDGKAKNGSTCTDGTYYYLITYTDDKGQQKKEGFLTLIR